jgi:hypothetical protein
MAVTVKKTVEYSYRSEPHTIAGLHQLGVDARNTLLEQGFRDLASGRSKKGPYLIWFALISKPCWMFGSPKRADGEVWVHRRLMLQEQRAQLQADLMQPLLGNKALLRDSAKSNCFCN